MDAKRTCGAGAGWCALAMLGGPAAAQQAIQTPAATQPGRGVWSLRELVRYTSYDDDPTGLGREADRVEALTQLSYGISGSLSATLEAPLVWQSVETDSGTDIDAGFDDLRLSGKWRFYQDNYGTVNTIRVSAIAGAEIPTGNGAFSSGGFDPFAGVVYTHIHGRHGWNLSLEYELTTDGDENPLSPGQGRDDALWYGANYLYRLIPEAYTGETDASLYGVVELNGVYETGGDHELMLGPGLLYEAKNIGLEAGVQVPLHQDLELRPDREFSIVFGVRILF